MSNHTGIPQNLLDAVTAILELEKGTVHMYDVAVKHLKNPYFRWIVGGFSLDHQEHAQELSAGIGQYGPQFLERVLSSYDKQRYKRHSLSISQEVLARDDSILIKVQKEEVRINRAYRHAIDQQERWSSVGEILSRNFAEERVHRAWVDTQL